MSVFYRLVKERHAADGGRWNPRGHPVVYASQSPALAIMEMLVHLPLEAHHIQFQLIEITLPQHTRRERYD